MCLAFGELLQGVFIRLRAMLKGSQSITTINHHNQSPQSIKQLKLSLTIETKNMWEYSSKGVYLIESHGQNKRLSINFQSFFNIFKLIFFSIISNN